MSRAKVGPKFRLALVEWWDAHQQQNELTFDEIVKEHKPALIHTHGYVLIDDDIGVWVASEWLPSADAGGAESFRQHTFVPRGMVKKITYRGQRRGDAKSTKERYIRRQEEPSVSVGDADDKGGDTERNLPEAERK